MGREGIEQYLYMMDDAFADTSRWHSVLKNLASVRESEWEWVPEGARRSVRDLAEHCGAKHMYQNHAFGDRTMTWETVPRPQGTTPEAIVAWLTECHREWRAGVASLADDAELTKLRGAPWGDERETRWLINTMIQHDLYHAGEINHIRAMRQGDDE